MRNFVLNVCAIFEGTGNRLRVRTNSASGLCARLIGQIGQLRRRDLAGKLPDC